MICYPDASAAIEELDQKSMITRILEVCNQISLIFTRYIKTLAESRTMDTEDVLVRFAVDVQTIQ